MKYKEQEAVQIEISEYGSKNLVEALFSLLDDSGKELVLDENGQIPTTEHVIGGLIPLKEWARRNGISPATARQKAGRGGFITARKIGRDWMISALEPKVDNRMRIVQKEKCAISDSVYMYRILNYLYRLNSESLPEPSKAEKAHRNYCKRIFIKLSSGFSGNALRLFEKLCDAMSVQKEVNTYYVSHRELLSFFDDEAWHTQNKGSSIQSSVTIDFKDYLAVLKNAASEIAAHPFELKIHGESRSLLMPWYQSLSWENDASGGVYFTPSNFFKMIFAELQ